MTTTNHSIRKITWICVLVLLPCMALAQDRLDAIFREFHRPGNVYYIFTNDAKVRPTASTDGRAQDILYAGDAVTVLEKTDNIHTRKGMAAYWLKVRYKKDGVQKEGYLWQGLLAPASFLKGDTRFVYGIQRMDKSTNVWKWTLQLKAVRNTQMIAIEEWKDHHASRLYAEISGGKGLDNVTDILRISYGGEACGITHYDYFFTWNGYHFTPLPALISIPDGDYSTWEEWIFPDDPNGQPGQLVKKAVHFGGSVADNYDNWYTYESYSLISYRWNGQELSKGITLGASGKPYLTGQVMVPELTLYTQADKDSETLIILTHGNTFSLATPVNYEETEGKIETDWLEIAYKNEQNKTFSEWIYLPDNMRK
ncbi:SH3 domain-containing protein [Sinomicrobium sp. M5D2P9]